MTLSPGTRIGPYEITATLGAGGMGQVYRARDTRLNRTVAVKALHASVAGDPERIARFEREAQLLASLHHPNIAGIYGLEQSPGATYLVLEFVDGRPLDALLREDGARPPAEAVALARQIADAIAAAHEKGIIHRDLKPGNVMITSDGAVKVLDFGLGKSLDDARGSDSGGNANSPTITLGATQAGIILGTAGYMSPEQAKGRAADRRSDVWSFGCLLFEMLTGSRAFDGEDVTDTIAAIVRGEPDMKALPASTPPALRRLLDRCLVKDRTQRLADMSVVRYILNEPDVLSSARDSPLDPRPAASMRVPLSRSWIAATALLGAAAATLAVLYFTQPSPAPVGAVRFSIPPPPGIRQMSNGTGDFHGGSISHDGRHVVFSGVETKTGAVSIYLRSLDAGEATVIPNTGGGLYPFWSPNNRSIAFYAHGKLKRIDIDGSALQDICDAPTGGWGGAWNRDDVIVAGINDPGPLSLVPARGGQPKPVTTLPPDEGDHDWPHFLPDGRHFVYTSWSPVTDLGTAYIGSIDSMDRVLVMKDMGSIAAWADPGHLLFTRAGSLMAQAINPQTFALEGDPHVIVTQARGPIIATRDGGVLYNTRPSSSTVRVLSINADGSGEQPVMEAGFYLDASFSRDGTRIAYARKEIETGTYDIWIRALASGGERRLTFAGDSDEQSPLWSPEGHDIVFYSNRKSGVGLYRKSASGAGEEKMISEPSSSQLFPYNWHAASGLLTYYGGLPSWKVMAWSPADGTSRDLLSTPPTNIARGTISPDGKWLAYDSRDSRFEVYLTTNPPSSSKWMVTTDGGAEPRWSKDGRTLYYVNSVTNALMATDVSTDGTPTFSTPRRIFMGPVAWGWFSSRSYDVDPRTGRFLVTVPVATGELTVILNWREMLNTTSTSPNR